MGEPIQQQIMQVQVYYKGDKKYLEGWTLYAMGINIPMDYRNKLYEYTQEEIDDLMNQYMQESPSIRLETIEKELEEPQNTRQY